MREMGYQSAVGVVLVFVGATVFMPAFYLFLERLLGPEPRETRDAAVKETGGRWLVRWQVPAWCAFGVPLLTFLIACFLFLSGRIETKTTPWDYIKGTLVERTFQFLKGSGNEFLDLLVEPVEGDIYQPSFIRAAWAFQSDLLPRYGFPDPTCRFEWWQREQGLALVVGFKEVGAVLGKIKQIAQESYKKDFPEQPLEVEDAFFLLEDGIDPEVNRQMWFSGGLRLVALAVMNDTVEFRMLIERVLRFAQEARPL